MESEDRMIKYHWSFFCVILTIGVTLLFLGIIYHIMMMLTFRQIVLVLISGILIFLLVYFLFQCPVRIIDTKEKIQLKLIGKTIDIPKDSILYIRPMDTNELNDVYRACGSGGFFGFTGKFKSPGLGYFYMYATELNNLFLVVTREKKFVVSCTETIKLHDS